MLCGGGAFGWCWMRCLTLELTGARRASGLNEMLGNEQERRMDYRKLSDDIADVVVEALQHFDHIDKKGVPQSFEETRESISGGMTRYRTDPIFRAKVQMLVSRLTAVVREHDVPNDSN